MDSNAPRGADWADIVEALHGFSNTLVVRSHYAEGHPAIARADEMAGVLFVRLLERIPEIVVALIDGELVLCERPFPDLRERLHVLSTAMVRHDIECIVFQRGMTPVECARLGRGLAAAPEPEMSLRDRAQAELPHVLLRFANLRELAQGHAAGTSAAHFVPIVAQMLGAAAQALAVGERLDVGGISSLARDILRCCELRTFVLTQRCWSRSASEAAAHATNVAMMTGAMALEASLPETTRVELTAAALLHDIGQLLLPEEIAGIPESLLEERARPLFRNHTFAGASAMLAAGAPPLWVAAALEHHRGVDGRGYPSLENNAPPDELVQIVSLASFFDRKRTLLERNVNTPEEVLEQASALEGRYFRRSVIERFVRALGVHPPGTTVELSDRQPALVLSVNGVDPWRPRVMLLRGPNDGKRLDLAELDASTGQYQRSIVRAIPPPLILRREVVVREVLELEPLLTAPGPSDARELLDRIIVPTALVTSPPAPLRSSAPPARSTYSSRPGSIEEVVTLPRRISSVSALPAERRSVPPPPIVPKPSATPSLDLAHVPRRTGSIPKALDHRGGFLLGFVDGLSSMEDIVDASGLPKDDVLAILQALLESGTIA